MESVNASKLGLARFWRNPPVRRLALWFLLAGAAAFLLVAGVTAWSGERLKQEWLVREYAVIGGLAERYPEAAEALPSLVVGPADAQRAAAGRAIAERQGLAAGVPGELAALASEEARRLRGLLWGSAAFVLAGLFAALLREYRKQLLGLRALASAAEETVKHNRRMSPPAYEEGELALLAHAVRELSVRLQETIGQLHGEKRFLKETIADISHQLKTPLASLLMYNELLGDARATPEERAEFLRICRKELERMEWLTLALLTIARLEADALELQRRLAMLAPTVARALEAVRLMAEERGVELRAEEREGPVECLHDPRWLGEALTNLAKNAVEHSRRGGRVTVVTERSSLFVRIRIWDEGKGVDERHLPHLFKKFYQTSPRGSGVGLGLALVKSIVERHGGLVAAELRPEGGLCITITLPQLTIP